MMENYSKLLIILSFLISSAAVQGAAQAETKSRQLSLKPTIPFLSWKNDWSKNHKKYTNYKKHNPYLEDLRHSQISQWAHEDWYVEDWTAQQDGTTLMKGFYAADILRDQKSGHASLPVLVVGPNFYRLSGLDKRRVAHTVAASYGITEGGNSNAFILEDWDTKMPIGVFDEEGLRLH